MPPDILETMALASLDRATVLAWNNFLSLHPALGQGIKAIGWYGVYTIPILWVIWWLVTGHRQRERLLSAIFAGLVAWRVINQLIKMIYFHPRPVHELNVREILFERPENAFPSDHVAFLAAIAFFFLLEGGGRGKEGWLILALAAAVGLARITLAFHYPSDVLVGFATGFVAAWGVTLIHRRLSAGPWEKLIALAHRLGLG